MKQYIISSFTSRLGGGNKAAVVLDDKGLNDEQMLNIAKKNNYSETAFIDLEKSADNSYAIRYFTPAEEVDICGHAALAAFYLLDLINNFGTRDLYHKTKAGNLKVINRDGIFFMQMKAPKIIEHFAIEEVIGFTTLKKEDIIPNKLGKVSIVSTGLKDAIIEVSSLQVLKELKIRKRKMIDFCKRKNIIGAHIVSRETIENDSDFFTRNFAPAVGIDEESATGTSNASLIYYIINENNNEVKDVPYKIEQGYFMGRPSNIYVFTKFNKTIEIFVGGRADFLGVEDIRL